jgi:hypothetical protein
MIIKFHSLDLHNFKIHRDLHIDFGQITRISGDNAQGKTSILEGIAWIPFGTDLLGGSKYDPSPANYSFDHVKAELILEVDGVPVKLGRAIEKGKTAYYVNDVPRKAGEFDEVVGQLFNKDLFLSLFNPSYFFTLHWEEQRKMLLQYVTSPVNKEVFAEMSRTSLEQKQADIPLNPQAVKLAELVKKHSLDDLVKIHSKNKTDMDKAYIAAQSRTKTLQDQLAGMPAEVVDPETQAKADALMEQIRTIEKVTDSAQDNNHRIKVLESLITKLKADIKASKERFPQLKDEPIQDTCRTCKQPLNEGAVEAVKADKDRRIQEYRDKHQSLIDECRKLEQELAGLEYTDVTEKLQEVRELWSQRESIIEAIEAYQRRDGLANQIDAAKADEEAKLASRNESIFILDAIKAFRAKEAELMAAKVKGMFEKLSIRLFEEQKNGELKNTFEIELDGKPYRKLSLSEGIRAGLEVRDVLSQQSEIIMPCFVDNSESITRFKQPNGQLIISRVVSGQELKIEADGEKE